LRLAFSEESGVMRQQKERKKDWTFEGIERRGTLLLWLYGICKIQGLTLPSHYGSLRTI